MKTLVYIHIEDGIITEIMSPDPEKLWVVVVDTVEDHDEPIIVKEGHEVSKVPFGDIIRIVADAYTEKERLENRWEE